MATKKPGQTVFLKTGNDYVVSPWTGKIPSGAVEVSEAEFAQGLRKQGARDPQQAVILQRYESKTGEFAPGFLFPGAEKFQEGTNIVGPPLKLEGAAKLLQENPAEYAKQYGQFGLPSPPVTSKPAVEQPGATGATLGVVAGQSPVGTIGTWIGQNGQGYSGAKKNINDQPASSTTGQPITPPAPVTPPITPQSVQEQIGTTQSQIADLQAQQAALTKYGLTDTEQLTKDASGNYVPIDTGDGGDGDEYDTGNEDFNAFLKFAQDLLQQMKDSGKIVNPAIEITPELIKQFEEQAIAEYSPYYKGQFSAIKGDLETDLSYLSEQYKRAVESKETTFKQNLETQREAEASRGMIFSGGRMTREQSLAQAEERSIAGLGTSLGYQAQKAGTKAERTIGSLNLGGITYPSYKPYSVSTKGMGGFAPLGERQLFAPTTGITGSLEREQLTAQQLRQAELEEAERKKRALTFYQ